MKIRCLRPFVLIFVCGMFVCGCLQSSDDTPVKSENIKSLANNNTDFGIRLYLNVKKRNQNLFFSPFSISNALSMTYAGAEGTTADEMKQVMHVQMEKSELNKTYRTILSNIKHVERKKGATILNSNMLWPHKNYPFLKSYIKTIEKYFQSGVIPLDYAYPEEAAKTINIWVEEKTNHLIKDLISPGILNADTRLVLTNSVYFKGSWKKAFDPDKTHTLPFYKENGQPVNAQMMNQTDVFSYTENDGIQAVDLPYMGDMLSMLIIVPKNPGDFSNLENSITSKNIDKCLSKMKEIKIRLSIPKFKIKSDLQLSKILAHMGMNSAFSAGADFSGMDGTKSLFLSAILHKAFVEVNEEGTEAAAATAAVVQIKSVAPQMPFFNANHPFIFFIRENINNTVLFMGKMADPTI